MKNKKDLITEQNAPEKVGKEQQLTTPPSLRQLDQLEKLSESELEQVVGSGFTQFPWA